MEDKHIVVALFVNALAVGGAEQQLLELARGMDKSRFKPIIATLFPFSGGKLEEEARAAGVELVSLNRQGWFDLWAFYRAFRLLRKRRVDVVQPYLTPATLYGLVPALAAGTPVKIVTERCGLRARASWRNSLYRNIEDFLSRFADGVVPNSQAGREYVLKRGLKPERARVIYNGINLDRLVSTPDKVAQVRAQMGVPPNGKVVGIVASLSPQKDHLTFLRAARIISHDQPQTRFALLGDGQLRPLLEAEAAELGIAPLVTFCGIQRDIGSYIGSFDVAVQCSVDKEGCSNVILESMALGKPVVATEVGGNPELVEPRVSGLLVPPGDPQALARAVTSLLEDPKRCQAMGEKGRARVLANFSKEQMVADYEKLWLELLEKKGRSRQKSWPG
ncbi:MAG: glycosyltransferase [Chloroflexi bacterium]|nr:glycosyltransferase [Chloroflexota bacterium]